MTATQAFGTALDCNYSLCMGKFRELRLSSKLGLSILISRQYPVGWMQFRDRMAPFGRGKNQEFLDFLWIPSATKHSAWTEACILGKKQILRGKNQELICFLFMPNAIEFFQSREASFPIYWKVGSNWSLQVGQEAGCSSSQVLMHHSPNTCPQESFTGCSGNSSPGNPWSDSEAGSVQVVPPLFVPYSNLQIEHFSSSLSRMLISTRGKIRKKLSTWLAENWMPPLSSSSSSGNSRSNSPLTLAKIRAACSKTALYSTINTRDPRM